MNENDKAPPWNINGFNTINLSKAGLPEVPLVGIHGQLFTQKPLEPHTHKGLIEIHYFARGEDEYWVEGKQHIIKAKDVIVTLPHEKHHTGLQGYGRLLYWLQVKVPKDFRKAFLELSDDTSKILSEKLWNLPCRHFSGDNRFSELVEEIFLLYHDKCEKKLMKMMLGNLVSRLLMLCISWSEKFPRQNNKIQEKTYAYSKTINTLLLHLEKNPNEMPDIKEMAQLCSLSIPRFKARFRQETGIPPKEFLLRQKIKYAKKMLINNNISITDIAYTLGFSSSQYFATVFRRFTGNTPVEFRNKI